MALAITGGGGLALLGGVLLLGHIVGSFELDVVLAAGDLIRASPLYPCGARAGAARRLHQVRAVPVPLLAAARDGGADAGVGLSAFGDDGQGRRVPAGAAVSGAGRHRPVVLRGDRRRRATLLVGAWYALFQHDLKGLLAYSTISHLGLITLLFGLSHADGGGRRRVPHHQPRDVQGLAVHGGRHHRPRDRHARHAPAGNLRRYMPYTARWPSSPRWRWRRAAAQRLPVQGNVLRRGAGDRRPRRRAHW